MKLVERVSENLNHISAGCMALYSLVVVGLPMSLGEVGLQHVLFPFVAAASAYAGHKVMALVWAKLFPPRAK